MTPVPSGSEPTGELGGQAPAVAQPLSDAERLQELLAADTQGIPNEEVFESLARLAARCLSAEFGFLTVVEDGEPIWRAMHQHSGAAIGDHHTVRALDHRLSGALIAGDRHLSVVDIDEHDPAGPAAWMGAQMLAADGSVVGSLAVADLRQRTWTDDDQDALTALAQTTVLLYTIGQEAVEAGRNRVVLETILENAPIGFGLYDEHKRFVLLNETLAAYNGAPIEAHLGREISEMLPQLPEVEEIIEAVLTEERPVIDVELTGETPASPTTEHHWLASYFPIHLGGGSTGVAALVNDVTERVSARDRADRLSALAHELALARTPTDVIRIMVKRAHTYLGGHRTFVALTNEGGNDITIHFASDAGAVDREVWPSGWGSSSREAIKTGQLIFIPDRNQREVLFPDSLELTDALDVVGSATLALRGRRNGHRGALTLAWDRALDRGSFPFAQFRTLTELCAQTLARTESAESQRQLAGSLQAALLATPAGQDGLDVALRYRPASRSLGFGGDWYDVVDLLDGRTALVVGDVAGHDPAAAARMAQIRTIVGDVLQLTDDLSQVFNHIERLASRLEHQVWASVCITIVDPDARTLTGLSAGHPPPLLLSPDGCVGRLPIALRPWLGLPSGPLTAEAVPYEPGSRLVAFTDGMVESRTSHVDAGIDAFAERLAVIGHGPVELMADRLIEYAVGSDLEDDIALLVAHLT